MSTLEAPQAAPVILEREGMIAIITLNRPDRMNAINYDLIAAFRQALQTFQADDNLRVAILTGAGKHFCTGGDLKDTRNGPDGETRLAVMHDCVRLLLTGNKPVLGAVEGNAYGAGFSYAAACDQVVAGASARFCAPFTGVGLVPDTGLAFTLPRRIGIGRARRMMMQGLVVGAEQALDWGLIEEQAPDGQALSQARLLAEQLLKRAPLAITGLRRLLARDLDGLEGSLADEYAMQMELLQSEDLKEARAAFAEKRPPHFVGR